MACPCKAKASSSSTTTEADAEITETVRTSREEAAEATTEVVKVASSSIQTLRLHDMRRRKAALLKISAAKQSHRASSKTVVVNVVGTVETVDAEAAVGTTIVRTVKAVKIPM